MALNKLQALKLIQFLDQSIKNPETSLKYRNQFTLLTSVVLSAQCTDTNVNNVTKNIYKKYYTPKHFADLGITKIKRMIKSIGLFNMKAKNLYNLSKILVEKIAEYCKIFLGYDLIIENLYLKDFKKHYSYSKNLIFSYQNWF